MKCFRHSGMKWVTPTAATRLSIVGSEAHAVPVLPRR